MTTDLKVYHLPRSRSLRVLWLLEELGLKYAVDSLSYTPSNFGGKFGGDDYTKVHPLNKTPAFADGDMVMFESVAIMQYIMDKYGEGNLKPAVDDPEYGAYLQWLHFGEATLAPLLATLMLQRVKLAEDERSAATDAWAQKELVKVLGMLEAQLGEHDYILESGFSAADISVGYCLLLMRLVKAHDQITDRLQTYWEVLTDRDAWGTISTI